MEYRRCSNSDRLKIAIPVSWSDTRIVHPISKTMQNFISVGCRSVVDADSLNPLDVDSKCKLFREFSKEEIVHSCGKGEAICEIYTEDRT